MAEGRLKIWYDAEGDYLQVIFDQKPGSEPRAGAVNEFKIVARPVRRGVTEGLGGHLKSGQLWTGENRPVGRTPPSTRVFYRIVT